ncbi:alpha-amylase [Aestuariimicrobium kwangyangense]|uniref:alpha-amylase n=1 Tax=Aestuariimicrobium kwangyangense TaxID=396389 RepID=UPI0004799514|nr:alpha-amylase family protein [Aestuariimicrobium kwangyangense]
MTQDPTNPRPTRHRARAFAPLAVLLLGLVVIAALVAIQPRGTGSSPSPTSATSPSGARTPTGPAQPVGVQLFQWPWTSIGAECPALAKDGYAFVQTSPPQESITGDPASLAPWWIVYQPVSYKLESTLGTRAEFAAMVKACHAAGVEVLVDAVINHMTGQDTPGVGTAGSHYDHYDYPGLYGRADFHHCGLTAGDEIVDYTNATEVQTCELVNLADLDTGSPKVRRTLTAYLADLQSLGVDGFRVDAAKHISPADLAAILDPLPKRPRLVLEVIRGGDDEPIAPEQYAGIGRVQEFGYARALQNIFGNYSFDSLNDFNTASWLPSVNAITFVDNHDTERNGETLSIQRLDEYRFGEAFLLGYGYGTPVVYSGYRFEVGATDQGPARDSSGQVLPATCTGVTQPRDEGFSCNHRDRLVIGMMAFHRAVGDAPAEVAADGNLATIVRRADGAGAGGGVGFVAINAGETAATSQRQTGLADGDHCNLADGCASTVQVKDGLLVTPVPAGSVVAITVGR